MDCRKHCGYSISSNLTVSERIYSWRAHQSRSLEVVLRRGWRETMPDCGYVVADGDGGIMISPLASDTDQKPGSAMRPYYGVEPVLLDSKVRHFCCLLCYWRLCCILYQRINIKNLITLSGSEYHPIPFQGHELHGNDQTGVLCIRHVGAILIWCLLIIWFFAVSILAKSWHGSYYIRKSWEIRGRIL